MPGFHRPAVFFLEHPAAFSRVKTRSLPEPSPPHLIVKFFLSRQIRLSRCRKTETVKGSYFPPGLTSLPPELLDKPNRNHCHPSSQQESLRKDCRDARANGRDSVSVPEDLTPNNFLPTHDGRDRSHRPKHLFRRNSRWSKIFCRPAASGLFPPKNPYPQKTAGLIFLILMRQLFRPMAPFSAGAEGLTERNRQLMLAHALPGRNFRPVQPDVSRETNGVWIYEDFITLYGPASGINLFTPASTRQNCRGETRISTILSNSSAE